MRSLCAARKGRNSYPKLVQRHVEARPAGPLVFFLKVLHAPRLVGFKAVKLPAPATIYLLGNADPAVRIVRRAALRHYDLRLTQLADDLLRSVLLAQVLSPSGSSLN